MSLLLSGLAALVVALAFFEQAPWAVELWPWESSRLSHIFIASILAAIAVPVIWIAASGELAAMQAGAIDLAITYGGVFFYLLLRAGEKGQPDLSAHTVVFGVAFVAMIATFVWSRNIPWRDERPTPAPVRAAFAVFAVMLGMAGTALVLGADILPWDLRPELSVTFGVIYLGAAAYFVHGVLRPSWPNAVGQLAGFLAYDIVLIGPFLDRFGEVHGGQRVSLIVYTGFVLASGALAVHYLFIDRAGSGGRADPG